MAEDNGSTSNSLAQIYKGDQVEFTIHRKPHCVVEYQAVASPTLCAEALKRAIKEVGKEVAIPGFRKGKAPVEFIKSRYPRQVDKCWQEVIADLTYKACATHTRIPLMSADASITFKMEEHGDGGAKLLLSFETIPHIPSVDPAKCSLKPVKRPDVSPEKIDETIRQAQMFFGNWQSIYDRPIQEGDFIIADLDITESDPPRSLFQKTRFEVTDRSMAKWMLDLVIGKNRGDLIEGVSVPDASLSEEEKGAFPPSKVAIRVIELQSVTLPPLDDAFAQMLGAETLSLLRERVATLLHNKASAHVLEEQRQQAVEFLLSHQFDIPARAVEQEAQMRLEGLSKDPSFEKQWKKFTDTEKRNLITQTKEQAERAVRLFYICRKIAAEQHLPITASAQEQDASSDLLNFILNPKNFSEDQRDPKMKQAEVFSQTLLEKAEDWVIAHAGNGSMSSPSLEREEIKK